MSIESNHQSIVLAGGCFWCIEALYKKVEGVLKITSGYAKSDNDNLALEDQRAPTYEEVCSGTTVYAEVVKLDFDPTKISLEALLKIFFEIHDPTTLNKQGGDVGTQYRSAVFYTSDEQKNIAEDAHTEAQENWNDPIVTDISHLHVFYPAEDYHQDYYSKNPNQPYCVAIISPKIEKFLKKNN